MLGCVCASLHCKLAPYLSPSAQFDVFCQPRTRQRASCWCINRCAPRVRRSPARRPFCPLHCTWRCRVRRWRARRQWRPGASRLDALVLFQCRRRRSHEVRIFAGFEKKTVCHQCAWLCSAGLLAKFLVVRTPRRLRQLHNAPSLTLVRRYCASRTPACFALLSEPPLLWESCQRLSHSYRQSLSHAMTLLRHQPHSRRLQWTRLLSTTALFLGGCQQRRPYHRRMQRRQPGLLRPPRCLPVVDTLQLGGRLVGPCLPDGRQPPLRGNTLNLRSGWTSALTTQSPR